MQRFPSTFVRLSRFSSLRSFAPAGLIALALAGAVSCSEAGGDSTNNESTGGSAAESTGGTTASTGGFTSTGGAAPGVGGSTGGSDAVGTGGDMGTGGVIDPNAPIQADPGDEGDGVFEDPGPYPLSPEASGPINGAPEGELSGTQTFTSPEVYEGWTFDYQIFVPAQYEAGKPAALAVFQDGVGAYGGIGVMQMFENLIHSGDMPVTIVLFVEPRAPISNLRESVYLPERLIANTLVQAEGQMSFEIPIPRSRITYSVLLQKLAPDDAVQFILNQLDKVALGHNTFTEQALGLIARSSEGIVRRIRNLCIASMMEAVRDRTKTVDLPQVNRVLMQPHWRRERDLVE